jgi:glycosyltransferase involved in cell wall biosynthesis
VSDAVEAARDDYLDHGRNGLLVPADDVEALADALLRAVTEDFALVRAAGRAMVAARFTWSASIDRLEALHREACDRSRGGGS